jgi:hypothetical protein
MVTEQTPETHPTTQNMYFDMGVCISVVYPKIIEEELQVNIFEGMDKYWWEGLAEETLTDRMSHNAVTARSPKEVLEAETPEDKLAALHEYGFGQYEMGETQNIFTMVGDDGNLITFKKAVLDTVEDSPAIGTLLNKNDEDPDAFYYVSRDDLYRVLAGMLEQDKTTNEILNNAPILYNVSLEYVRRLNYPAQFRLVGERYATDTGYKEAFVDKTAPSSLVVSDKYLSSRGYAGEVFGTLPQNVKARYMSRRDGELTNADGYADAATVKLSFLPSERLVDAAEDDYYQASSAFVPVINKNHNNVQYNGRPLEPKIMFPEDFTEENLHTTPSWVDTNQLRLGYGKREETSRGSIGWHRSGPRFAEPLMQDHYEYVIAGEAGFMPYVLSPDGEVALIREESSSMSEEEIAKLKFNPVLRDPKEMPTFTISGTPLDGAGILVINGNLVISTEFAYHGTLVVMGDLIMQPERMELPKRNENGLIVDAEGNVLLNDYQGWYYTKNGRQDRVPSEPEMIDQMASKLVLQGQLFLGGSVRNIEVDGYKGRIDIRGSSGAMEDTTGSMFDGKEKRGLYRLLYSDVDSQSEVNELWSSEQ